eukprot:995235-Amorphochlora_amoeboformis.AAC.1
MRQCHHCGKKGQTKRTCWELHTGFKRKERREAREPTDAGIETIDGKTLRAICGPSEPSRHQLSRLR